MTKPNIVVLGVDHSGTSIITAMLESLGWQNPYVDPSESYRENTLVRAYNRWVHVNGGWEPGLERQYDYGKSMEEIYGVDCLTPRNFQRKMVPYWPWVVKDPRLYAFWDHWEETFLSCEVLLVALTRDVSKLRQSYMDRGQNPHVQYGPFFGSPCEDAQALVLRHYMRYLGPKLHLPFDDVVNAISLFDVNRALRKDPSL